MLARVNAIAADGHGGSILKVEADIVNPVIGESIAVNGCCLTLTSAHPFLEFQAGPETLARTNLGSLKAGDRVNLERALRLGDPLGGHIVTGHVDCTGTLTKRIEDGDWQTLWFDCPASLDDLMVHKGSITVDGVSLTVVDVEKGKFSVMLIHWCSMLGLL